MTKESRDDLVAKTVLTLQERHGVCRPGDFVEEVSKESHPLHDMFEWDDTVAAYNWRKHQARQLIGRVKIVLAEQRIPAFVHARVVRNDQVREGYLPIEVALSDKQIAQQVIDEAIAGLNGWHARLSVFEQAKPAAKALRQAIKILRDNR